MHAQDTGPYCSRCPTTVTRSWQSTAIAHHARPWSIDFMALSIWAAKGEIPPYAAVYLPLRDGMLEKQAAERHEMLHEFM